MLNYIRAMIVTRTKTERGASAVEYGLLVALIAAVIIGSVILLGGTLNDTFDGVNTKIENGTSGTGTGGSAT